MRSGVGIQRADDGFDLAECAVGRCFVGRHDGECAHAFVIHAEVFGIRAGHQQFGIVFRKRAQTVCVFFQAVGKALVGKVKQRQPAFFGRHFGQRVPLFGCGVDAGRVVAAAVQQHHVACLRLRQIFQQPRPIQAVRLFVVIAVIADVHAHRVENGVVVRPGGRGNPHVFRIGLAFDEFGRHAQRTGATQTLRGFGTFFCNDFVSRAKQQFLRGGVIGGHAVDGQVVFGVFLCQQARFGFFNGFQNRCLSLRVFIHADAQIDFFGAGFGFEGFAQAQNRVGRRGLDVVEQHGTAP